MNKYLLNEEKKEIYTLLSKIKKQLYKNNKKIDEIFIKIIRNNKDSSIEDILETYTYFLIKEMYPLLEKNITLGLQFGIKNDYFEITSYGGKYIKENSVKNITEDTLFSFDSISKLLTTIIAIKNINLNTKINEYNNNYNLDATIESILKFTAYIKTKKRIDHLTPEETITLLKECKEDLIIKKTYKNYYEYSDIGYMILRQIIPNFLMKLDTLIQEIDANNLTYDNERKKDNITGGKINEEYITPDSKGRGIPFPGHTGLYGNIEGLLNLFFKITNTDTILTKKELETLLKEPYKEPIVYKINNQPLIVNNNRLRYICKTAGFQKIPYNLTKTYDKLLDFDIPNTTTTNSIISTGTCGSWTCSDKIFINNTYEKYTIGILTNPYSYVENKQYPEKINQLSNSQLKVNQNGVIINYPNKLNEYKEILATYATVLTLLTTYIKTNDKKVLNKERKIVKRM